MKAELSNELTEVGRKKVEKAVAKMVEVMSLYPKQEEAVKKIKTHQIAEAEKIQTVTKDVSERMAAHSELMKATTVKLIEATSAE